MTDYTRLYWTIPDCTGLYEIIVECTKLHWTIPDYARVTK